MVKDDCSKTVGSLDIEPLCTLDQSKSLEKNEAWIDRWMDGRMDEWVSRWMEKWMDK